MRDFITAENVDQLVQLSQARCGWITGVAWSSDGMILAIAGADGVRLYVGAFGGGPTHILEGHGGHIKGIAFSPIQQDGDQKRLLLASCSADTTVRIWDVGDPQAEPQLFTVLTGHTDSVEAVAFSPTFSSHPRQRLTLASCGNDFTIRLYDVETQTLMSILRGHRREVTSVTFALEGNVLFSGGWDHTVRLWDAQSETEGTILGQHDDWVRQVCVNPAGTMLASASKDMSVGLWDAHSGEQYAMIHAHPGGADCVTFSPDGSLMATGGRDNLVRIWSVQRILQSGGGHTTSALITLTGHQKPVMSLAFNPTGTLLASGSGDNTVKLWGVGDNFEDLSRHAESAGREIKTALLSDDADDYPG